MKNILKTVIIILTASLFFCCGQQKKLSGISEGKITYQVIFPKTENKSQLIGIMPDNIEMSFKNGNTAMNIKGFAGSFNISFITDRETNKYYSLVRIMVDRYMYVTDSNGIAFGYDMIKDMKIEYLPDTSTICGFLCNKAVAHCNSINRDLELWYTNDIKIPRPNINNAFRDLDGVLMKFQVILSGIFMEFTAKEVSEEPVSDDAFKIPDNYKQIQKDSLERFLKSFDPDL
jgi:GLPGLI family protein